MLSHTGDNPGRGRLLQRRCSRKAVQIMRLVRRAIKGTILVAAMTPALLSVAEEKPKSQTDGEPVLVAEPAPAPRSLALPLEVAERVGHQVWLNETGGNADEIVAWNDGEEFLSLGIGHFIWFPAGRPSPFDESFPRVVQFLRQQKVQLPDWLNKTPVPPCPWQTRADFLKAKATPRLVQLKKFLIETRGVQTQFLVDRAQSALDTMLAKTPEETQRRHIAVQFTRVVRASKDLYPIIDYINFKGEGINPDETIFDPQTKANEGWGLKQVLLGMSGSSGDPNTVLAEFAESARVALLRRIRNHPQSRKWQEGWLNRIATYRKPLVRITIPPPATGTKE
jgi:hypothetical protein